MFKKKVPKNDDDNKENMGFFARQASKLYQSKPNFRYPLPILIGVNTSLIASYEVSPIFARICGSTINSSNSVDILFHRVRHCVIRFHSHNG
jgi:hypothetical protein